VSFSVNSQTGWSGQYRPASLPRVYSPKPGRPGEQRPVSIPTVADRVVMTAAKLVLEPIVEAGFLPVSFGFGPKRSAHDALEAVRVGGQSGSGVGAGGGCLGLCRLT